MDKINCRCGHEMTKIGLQTDSFGTKKMKRVKYVCPHCGNEAFLDPEKWNL